MFDPRLVKAPQLILIAHPLTIQIVKDQNKLQENRKVKWLPKIRFSMRTLFILVTVLCVLLVPLSVNLYQARQQRLAVQWVLVNGDCYYDYQRDDYGDTVSATPTDNQWLRNILGNDFFDPVVKVHLYRLAFTDISPLSNLTQLEELLILDENITDITPLAKLINLRHLTLQTPLDHFAGYSGIGNKVTDLTPLSKLTNLRFLEINTPMATDLAPLENLVNLERLDIHGPNVTDLTPLENLTNLQFLRLDTPKAIDLSLLLKLSNLESLSLSGMKLPEAEVDKLKKALPNCKVY